MASALRAGSVLFTALLLVSPLVAAPERSMAVTIENDEWIFACLCADARRAGDDALAARLAAAYLDYMEEVFAFVEELSRGLLGREPAQVLLVHANELNADHLGALLDHATARGYRFVPLDEAVRDPAYALPDDYAGAWGISWLHHWEMTRGRPRTPSPDPPPWIVQAYERAGR